MHINHLPDDDLRCILLHFPLQQLLQLRLVCSHWQAVIEEICAAKRSLKIFASIGNVVTYVRSLADFHLTEEAAFALKDIGADDDLLETPQPKQLPPNQLHSQQEEEEEENAGYWSLRWSNRPLRQQSTSRRSLASSRSQNDTDHLSSYLLQGDGHIFPKVEQLTFFKHSFNLHFAAFSQLSSLTLNCQFVAGFNGCLQQLSQLNTLHTLHLLRVGFELRDAMARVSESAQLVFGRLEELSVCGCFDHSAISIAFLRLLSSQARKLTMKLPTINFEEFAALCEETALAREEKRTTFRPDLLTALTLDGLVDTELPFGRQIAQHCRFIDTICAHFSGLQHLQLGLMREVTHHQVAPSLARLAQLRSLTLLRHFWVTENVNQAASNQPIIGNLPTVKSLHLICSANNSFNYSSLGKFSLIFPSLTTLKVSAEEDMLAKFKHHLGVKKVEQSSSFVLPPSVEVQYRRLGDTIDYLGRHQIAYRRYIDELVAQIAEILRTWFRAKGRRGPRSQLLFLFKLAFFFLGFIVALLIKVLFW